MEFAHRALADAAVAVVVVGLVWSILLAAGRPGNRQWFARFTYGAVGVLLVAALVGVGQIASGAHPAEDLHLVYGATAVVLLPLARSFVGGNERRDAWLMAAAYLVLAGVLLRLFVTG